MPVPEGFVLDPPPASTPGLPEGFILDKPSDSFDALAEQAQKQEAGVTDKGIRGAQVVGTYAVKGATEALGVPAHILGMSNLHPEAQLDLADWLRRQVGLSPIPPENRAEYTRIVNQQRIDPTQGAQVALNKVGIPTNPVEEARRLGVDTVDAEGNPVQRDLYSKGVHVLGQAARFGTMGALTGAGPVPSALSAVGAGVGQAVGGETGALVGSMIAPLAGVRKITSEAAPTLDSLRTAKNAAYDASEKAGVIISAPAFKRLADEVNADLAGRLGTGGLHPQANAARKYLEEQAARGNVTLKGLDMVRQEVKGTLYTRDGRPRQDVSSSDSALVGDIVDKIDDFIAKLKPGTTRIGPATGLLGPYAGPDVIMGDAAKGGAALVNARVLNTRLAKAEKVQKIINDADTYSPAFDLTVRNGFGKLARNEKQMRLFTPEERAAIDKMVAGGPVTSTLKFIGRAAPTRNSLALTLDVLGMGYGHYFNNPQALAAAVTMALTAEISKRLSIGLARRNAQHVVDLMAMGYRPPASLDMQALMPAIIQGYKQFSGAGSEDQTEPAK